MLRALKLYFSAMGWSGFLLFAGVGVVMITGDSAATARAIAAETGTGPGGTDDYGYFFHIALFCHE